MPYKDPQKQKEACRKYELSEKGKATRRKYNRYKRRPTDQTMKSKRERQRRYYYRHHLSNVISRQVYKSLKRQKKGRTWETLVGYSLQDLKRYLEGLFQEGMSWDNYGQWHIDHILPISSFDITSYDCEDFKECWSLKNLQPLWAKENLVKGDRL